MGAPRQSVNPVHFSWSQDSRGRMPISSASKRSRSSPAYTRTSMRRNSGFGVAFASSTHSSGTRALRACDGAAADAGKCARRAQLGDAVFGGDLRQQAQLQLGTRLRHRAHRSQARKQRDGDDCKRHQHLDQRKAARAMIASFGRPQGAESVERKPRLTLGGGDAQRRRIEQRLAAENDAPALDAEHLERPGPRAQDLIVPVARRLLLERPEAVALDDRPPTPASAP